MCQGDSKSRFAGMWSMYDQTWYDVKFSRNVIPFSMLRNIFYIHQAKFNWDNLPLSIRSTAGFEAQWKPFHEQARKVGTAIALNSNMGLSGTASEIVELAENFRANASASRLGSHAVRAQNPNLVKAQNSKAAQVQRERKQKKAQNEEPDGFVKVTGSLWKFPANANRKMEPVRYCF